MEPYMFTNGLPILYYCDHEPLLRIRQLSKAMRKRVFYIVRDKKVLVRNDPKDRAKYIFKWIYERTILTDSFYPVHPFKKFNYYDDDKTIDLNAEIVVDQSGDLPPERQPFKSNFDINYTNNKRFPSLYFDRIPEMRCPKEILKIMPKHTFDLVDTLFLPKEEYPGAKEALQRIKRVTEAVIVNHFLADLNEIHWLKTLKMLCISRVNITSELELPSLTNLYVWSSATGLSKLKCPKLEVLEISAERFDPSEIAGLTTFKILKVEYWHFDGNEHFLPKGLKHIRMSHTYSFPEVCVEPIVKQCPGLFSFECDPKTYDFKCFQGGNLRKINYLDQTKLKGKSTVRLKHVKIDSYNKSLFNKHPEIISRATFLEINSFGFDWKHLPDGCKQLKFSVTNVLGKKRIDKHIDKLKGRDILTIALEKASSARKILKVAARVETIFCGEEVEELRKEFAESGCEFRELYPGSDKEKNCCIF